MADAGPTMARLRVLMVSAGSTGGMWAYTDSLCRGIATSGVEVTLLGCAKWPAASEGYHVERLLHTMERHDEWSTLRWAADRILKATRNGLARNRFAVKNSFDVVHVQVGTPLTDQVLLPRLSSRRPVVLTVHDVVPHAKRFHSRSSFVRRFLAAPHRIIVHHDGGKQILRERFTVPEDRVDVIPHGFSPVDNNLSRAEARQRLDLPQGGNLLLFFGGIRPNKGLDVLLNALPQVVAQHPDVRLVIAGRPTQDEGFSRYDHIIQTRGLSGRIITRLEFIPESQADMYFAAVDMVILPYQGFESQSGVLLRAYANTKPVVVSDTGAMGELVRNDGVGLVVKPGEPNALAQAIVRGLSELPRYQACFSAELWDKYSWGRVGRMTAQSYARAIEAWRRGAYDGNEPG